MKLLFDENLSPVLPGLFAEQFPGSQHVRDCGLMGCPDDQIWKFAKDNGFVVVSKDSDFVQRSLLHGAPPKLVWLRLGNCSRHDLLRLVTRHARAIQALEESAVETVLILS